MEIHAEVNVNETVTNKKVTKSCAVIHTKFKRYTTGHSDRFESEREKIEKKVVIRYSIKNSLSRRIRSKVKYCGRVLYEPLYREGFSGHIAEFCT